MRVEVLTCPDCEHGQQVVPLIEAVLQDLAVAARVEVVLVDSPERAAQLGFPGSPTVRIDGRDVEPDPPAGAGLG